MIRLLAVVLAMIGFLSIAPVLHANDFATGRGAVSHGGTPSFMADGLQAQCVGGTPCLLDCAACFPAPAGQAGDNVLAESKTNTSTEHFASFDLSWRLYRPPKAG